MSKTYTGFVAKLTSKSGNTNGRAWTAHSGRVEERDTGVEYDLWFKFGFEQPPCQEGDYIQFQADDNGQVTKGTIKVSSNPPARPQSQRSGGGGQRSGGDRIAPTKTSDLFGEIGGFSSEDDIARIVRSTALNQAVATVALLLENDALVLSGAKTKAGQAKRFDEVTAAINKIAVGYFFDLATGRKLESVQDPGVVAAGNPGDLPGDADEEPDTGDDDAFGDAPGGDDAFPENGGDDEHFG